MKKLLLTLIICLFTTQISCAKAKLSSEMISYTDTGEGLAPLVLIHAFPTNQTLWKAQVDGLKNYFRVITVDLWGFGQSGATDGSAVTMTTYADEVKNVLDHLHIQKAIIGGESMGGYITLAFLQKYPDMVSGVILADTQAIADSDETKAKREAGAQDVLAHGTTQYVQNFLPKALSPQASDATRNYLQNILNSASATGIASALRGMALRADTHDVLANATQPILILTGDQDSLISPQQSEAMHALVPTSRLVYITHSGHLSNLEQPEQWNQAVIAMFYQAAKLS